MTKLQILGTGCPRCSKLAENAEAAAKGLGIEFTIEKVTDINEIMKFGVMMTPALVINGEVKAAGRIPATAELANWLTTSVTNERSS